MAAGHDIPESVARALDVWPVCLPYRAAWDILSGARHWSVGVSGAIPSGIAYSEMSAYAHDHGFAEAQDDLEDFVRLVRAQDDVWMDWYAAAQKGHKR